MSKVAVLLCRLGRHRPRPGARWNQGYGFTDCARCGCDLVRSMIGDWRTPPVGHRVVWRAAMPPVAKEALSVRLSKKPPPPPGQQGAAEGSPFDFSDFDRDGPPNKPPSPVIRPRSGAFKH